MKLYNFDIEEYNELPLNKRRGLDSMAYDMFCDDEPDDGYGYYFEFSTFYGSLEHKKYLIKLIRKYKLKRLKWNLKNIKI